MPTRSRPGSALLCFENTGNDLAYSTNPPIKLFNAAACYFASAPGGPPGPPTGITITGINGTGQTNILTGASVTVAYNEPTGQTDLQKTTISYQLDGGPSALVMDVTATSGSGGGAIQQSFAVQVPNGFRQALTVSVSATNPAGTSTAQVAKTVDRTAESSSGVRR